MRNLIAAFLAVSAAGAAAAQQPQVFRSAGDLVRVFTTVTGNDGRLVTTLTQSDFEVRDDGKAQPIALFDNSPQPIRLIVLLDVSGSMEGNLPLLRAAADQLVTRLQPHDMARLGTFGREVAIGPTFTRDSGELLRALPAAIDPTAPTPLWRAVDDAITAFGDTRDDRRVVLVLSDGHDSGPVGFGGRYVSQVEVMDRARNEDVMIYAVGMRSRGRQMQPGIGPGGLQAALVADLPDPGLGRVAEETGGGYLEIRMGQDLAASFAAVVDELHSQYLIGFAPPKRDGKKHKIDVRVSNDGMKARGRKSYLAPKEVKK
jgi:Ca-activated chloride channel family protein